MRISTGTLSVSGIAVAAFAIGRLGFPGNAPAFAIPAAPVQASELEALGQAMAEAGEPGPHHASLEPLVGDWDATFSIYPGPGAEPIEVTCTIERKWILGGRFIKEEVKGTVEGGGPFEGIGFLGYDNVDGQYEVAWVENSSTSVVFDTGWFDPEEQVLHLSGTRRDALDHTIVRSWSALNIASPTEHRFVAWQVGADGIRFKGAEGAAKRRPTR